jgi:hypothetical protein
MPSRQNIKGSTIALIVSGVLFALLAVLAIYLVVIDFAGSTVVGNQRAATECQENLQKIVAAFQAYHDANGNYPPAYTVDPKTQLPLHSWRVLILPYLEEDTLYSQIDLTKPWDSLENQQFNTLMPEIYHCPAHSNQSGAYTHYVGIEGAGFLFNGSKTVTASDILDDPRETIAVVEIANSNINWMSPMDLQDLNAGYSIGSDPSTISSLHAEDSANVGFLDGSSRLLTRQQVAEANFRAMMTIAGGD